MYFILGQVDLSKSIPKTPLNVETKGNYHYVQNQSKTIDFTIRMRAAYPTTYSKATKEGAELGYGNPYTTNLSDEYLQVHIEPSGKITIRCDAICTVPLFYAFSEGVFVISNEYAQVVKRLPKLTLNTEALLEALSPGGIYAPPLWKEMQIAEPLETITVTAHGVSNHKAPDRPWAGSQELPKSDPNQFISRLHEHLQYFYKTRLRESKVACELSGGLDSSLIPLHLRRNFPDRQILTATIIFEDAEVRKRQTQKLNDFHKIVGNIPLTVQLDHKKHYTLRNMVANNDFQPFYLFQDYFTEVSDELAGKLASHGVDVVVTGMGGDEMFENSLTRQNQLFFGEEMAKERIDKVPPYLTDLAREKIRHMAVRRPPMSVPPLSGSWYRCQTASSNIYLQHNIWPVSPFSSPDLFTYCQGLPIEYRANRNIFRAYYQAHQVPSSLYHSPETEAFNEFFTPALCYTPAKELLLAYAKDSFCERLGLVNTDRLVHEYENLENSHDYQAAYLLSAFTRAEVNLHLAAKRVLLHH